MPYEFKPASRSEKTGDIKKVVSDFELKNIERDREMAKENLEMWSGSLKAVLEDLAEIEEREGELPMDDPRMMAVRLCLMRTDEAKTMLRDLKAEREEVVNAAGLN